MPLPSFVTQENVKFNGVLDNAVILSQVGPTKELILWDSLSVADQSNLTKFINDRGGMSPLAGPTSGSQLINFGGSIVGGNSTGLSSVSTSTAGTALINLGGAKTNGSISGLSQSVGSSAKQSIVFSNPLTNGKSTGLVVTSGYQYVNLSTITSASDATGIPNTATVRTANIKVDGIAYPVAVAGNTVQTYTTLIGVLNGILNTFALVSLDIPNSRIVVTSLSTGSTSTIAITAGTLFPLITNFNNISLAVIGSGSVATLTANINIDGVDFPISILSSSIPTIGDLVAAIQVILGSAGTIGLSGSNIIVSSPTFGVTSKVTITGSLFSMLKDFLEIAIANNGGGISVPYSANVLIDGTINKTIFFRGIQGDTIGHVISEINIDLGGSATATLAGGNILITSSTTGKQSSLKIQDTGFLFSKLTSFAGISYVQGNAPTSYTASFLIDGSLVSIVILGNLAQTFTTLVSALNSALTGVAVVSIISGDLLITSSTTGVSSKVEVTSNGLFKSLIGYKGSYVSISGCNDILSAMKVTRSVNGSLMSSLFKIVEIGTKPTVPHYVKHALSYTYWDGLVWKYLDDDTTV